MTGWYGINRVFTCYVLWNGWKPLLDSGGVGIHGLPSSANFTKYSTSLSLRDVPGTSSCTVLEYNNNTYQVQLGNGTPLLINDRFTLLNRSFIENKGRSAVINVSRTSGRLYSFVMTTVQFIAWYSQGTRPLLLLAEWVDGSSILQQGPPERIVVWASYLGRCLWS